MNIIKLFLLFIFFYFIFNLIKGVINIKQIKKDATDRQKEASTKNNPKNDSKIIELNKDQYKVE